MFSKREDYDLDFTFHLHSHKLSDKSRKLAITLNTFQMSSKTQEAGTVTEPESLGPCEPGTAINLDGIVWNETKGGKI